MTLADKLAEEIYSNEYFTTLFNQLEKAIAENFLFKQTTHPLSEKQCRDMLRFADILSHASSAEARNTAYRLIALLFEAQEVSEALAIFAHAVLSKLGNFPGLHFLDKSFPLNQPLPIERELEKITKESKQKASYGNKIFTDSQFKIRAALEEYDNFSFSGPTSIGKSFIIKDYIHSLLNAPKLNDGCIVVLVPTRALINQMVDELQQEITNKTVNITASPAMSPFLKNRYAQTIYVLTPERLIYYVANVSIPVAYLFVDEAQKVISENDERSSIYYHAIYETNRRFATKLVFASPNIPNPEIFLEIFTPKKTNSIAVTDRTVSQNKYFIDLVAQKASYFSNHSDKNDLVEKLLEFNNLPQTLTELITHLGKNTSNLVYCNSSNYAVEQARLFAENFPKTNMTPELSYLISFANEHVHTDYYLMQCLSKGIAFHHGKMPQEIRKKIEELFIKPDSPLKFIFCTPTLLEGVNLPAKNIFILAELRGKSAFEQIYFENLIGRAGRLTQEFSGNVICISSENKTLSKKHLLTNATIKPSTSFLNDTNRRQTKYFKNIVRGLQDKDVVESLRNPQKVNMNNFAVIALLHQIQGKGSPLITKFIEKIPEAKSTLERAAKINPIPTEVLHMSPTIKAKHQHKALKYIQSHQENSQFAVNLNKIDALPILHKLYELYNWEKEEKDIIPPGLVNLGVGKSRLNYWDMLMRNWISSTPLNLIIKSSINFHEDKGNIWDPKKRETEPFVRSAYHINIVIEQIMEDIENGLNHKIAGYLQNYYDLSLNVLGKDLVGPNWAKLLEYKTLNKQSISLQNTGFSKATAERLLTKHLTYLKFDHNDELISINEPELQKATTKNLKDKELNEEITKILR